MNEREKVKRWIDHLANQRFFGSFQILFENGYPVHTRQETSRKPADLKVPPDLPAEVYEHSDKHK